MNNHTGSLSTNVHLYTIAQALGAATPPIIISLGGLVSIYLGAAQELATMPVFMFNLGLALSTLPAAYLMRRLGRKPSYLIAAVVSVASASISTYAIMTHQFWLFCVGTLLAGYYAANIASYRFAVTDGLEATLHSKAISRVMIGGLAAAVIGPQMVVWTQDSLLDAQYAGSFIGQAVLALLAIGVLFAIKPNDSRSAQSRLSSDTKLIDLLRRPKYLVAVAAGVTSYALMAFIMTAAPLAMVSEGHQVHHAALGIQWHVLAMFAPSFFTGRLMMRFGKAKITAVGLFLIAVSGGIALLGLELAHFWGSLILLGLGWNFGYIGATALVAESHTAAEKNLAQGFNDFMIFSVVALGSFLSGVLLNVSGWYTLNLVIFPIISLVLMAMLWQRKG